MKKFKKVASLVIVMALGASALTGCSAGGGDKKEGGGSAGSAQTVGFSVSTLYQTEQKMLLKRKEFNLP